MSDFVIISGYHDYRSERRSDLHFIADELRRHGSVFFLSVRFSELTRLQEDPRHDLRPQANHLQSKSGIECLLWKTPLHPIGLPGLLRPVERLAYDVYVRLLPDIAREKIRAATTILVESGIAVLFLDVLRRLSPEARIIYMASDGLATINQSATIRDGLLRSARLLDGARLPSPYLISDIPPGTSAYFIPHGIDKSQFAEPTRSPYAPGTLNAVSVGSMLFDRSFFDLAGPMFPHVTFHAIGSGLDPGRRGNTIFLPGMPFRETLPYLTHADVAIAPYRQGAPRYLTHTSLKLTQYNYLGKPAVCPAEVEGAGMGRFGYVPGDAGSIRHALRQAFDTGSITPAQHLTWRDVTERILDPTRYPDTQVDPR